MNRSLNAHNKLMVRLVTHTLGFGDVRLRVAQRATPSQQQDDAPVSSGEDSTGLDVWPASLALAAYLQAHTATLLRGSSQEEWVELGAGVGVPGMLAAKLGVERVVLADFDPNALRVATQNIELNDLVQRCLVQELDFRDPSSIRREAFSIALGADILYASMMVRPLVTTIMHVLSSTGVLLLAHQPRFSLILRRKEGHAEAEVETEDSPWVDFLAECEARGLTTRRLGSFHVEDNREPDDVLVYAVGRDPQRVASLPALMG